MYKTILKIVEIKSDPKKFKLKHSRFEQNIFTVV